MFRKLKPFRRFAEKLWAHISGKSELRRLIDLREQLYPVPRGWSEAVKSLELLKESPFIWGHPGIGKSDMYQKAAEDAGLEIVRFFCMYSPQESDFVRDGFGHTEL